MSIKKLVEKHNAVLKQLFHFGCVGIVDTILSLAIYYILLFVGVYYLIANAFGFFASVLNAFIFNRYFVFKSKAGVSISFLKTFLTYIMTFFNETLILFIVVDILDISKELAPFISIVINTPINFLLMKFWAMRE